jgi:hypothetical protein
MSTTVRVETQLLPYIDGLVDEAKDEFGVSLYNSRKDVIEDAVKRFLKRHGFGLASKNA